MTVREVSLTWTSTRKRRSRGRCRFCSWAIEEHDDDDREAAKSEPVELEVAEKLHLDEMRAEQDYVCRTASRRIGGTIPHRSYASREGDLVESRIKKIEKADGGRRPTNKCSTFLTPGVSNPGEKKKKQKTATYPRRSAI
jgi:hypothetical protein